MSCTRRSLLLGLGGATLPLLGCEERSIPPQKHSTAPAKDLPIEVFSWWGRVGDSDALNALAQAHRERHATDTVMNASADLSGLVRRTLEERLLTGDPPDLFQANVGHDLMRWVLVNGLDARESKLQALDDDLEGLAELRAALPEDLWKQVTFEDQLFGVPANLHRVNEVFLSLTLGERYELTVPGAVEGLLELGPRLDKEGVPLLSMGTKDPWTLSLFAFESVLVSLHGADFYDEYFRGRLRARDPRMLETLRVTLRLMDFANPNHARLTWMQASEQVLQNEAWLTPMGDWGRTFFLSRKRLAGHDYGELPFPGTDGTVVFTSDAFGLPRGAKNSEGALRLLSTLATPGAQRRISETKGTLPARSDADASPLDSALQRTRRCLGEGRLILAQSGIVPARFARDVSQALAEMVRQRDIEPAVHTLDSRYALLR